MEAGKSLFIDVNGSIDVAQTGGEAGDDLHAHGVQASAADSAQTSIDVAGAVTVDAAHNRTAGVVVIATGENSFGMNLDVSDDGSVTVAVEGTVSGEDISIRAGNEAPTDNLHGNLTGKIFFRCP